MLGPGRPERRGPDGFSLIELLVVIIIIGLLAAIALPIFLNQRRRAFDSAAQSDLRNVAEFEELLLADTGSYGTLHDISQNEPDVSISKGVTLTIVGYDAQRGYCLSARHSASPRTWYYDSRAGGIQPTGSTGCPVTVGVPGDTATG